MARESRPSESPKPHDSAADALASPALKVALLLQPLTLPLRGPASSVADKSQGRGRYRTRGREPSRLSERALLGQLEQKTQTVTRILTFVLLRRGVRGKIGALLVIFAVSQRAAAHEATPPVAQVEVTGQRKVKSASTRAIGRDVLEAAPQRTGSDLLRTVPGVFLSQHSGEGKAHQIFLRGFDAVHGQDVELWVGGAPVNDVSNIHGQGYADLHFVIPEVVQGRRAIRPVGLFLLCGTKQHQRCEKAVNRSHDLLMAAVWIEPTSQFCSTKLKTPEWSGHGDTS